MLPKSGKPGLCNAYASSVGTWGGGRGAGQSINGGSCGMAGLHTRVGRFCPRGKNRPVQNLMTGQNLSKLVKT